MPKKKPIKVEFSKPSAELITRYENIAKYCNNLYHLLKSSSSLPFGLKDFPLIIKMDIDPAVDGLGQFVNKYKRIAAVLGIDESNKFTISFVALNAAGNIIAGQDGQETWPPKDIYNFSELLDPPLPPLKQ